MHPINTNAKKQINKQTVKQTKHKESKDRQVNQQIQRAPVDISSHALLLSW